MSKNIANAKVNKQKPMNEQEKKEAKEKDIKEFIETQIAVYEKAFEHTCKPAKFLEVLTSARMFLGKDDIDFYYGYAGIEAIEEAYRDIIEATKKITIDMIEKKEDPYADLLQTIYKKDGRELTCLADNNKDTAYNIEEIFERYLYNMQIIQAGSLYLEHFFKVEYGNN